MIEAGTVAAPLSDDRFTRTPPVAAGALSVTVPVELCPPVNAVGFSVKPLMVPVTLAAGVSIKAAVAVLADTADMFAVVGDDTGDVDTVNVTEVCPAGMVTEAGTVADALDEESVTRTPPIVAGAVSVTVPVEVPPPAMVVGFKVKPLMVPVVVPAAPIISAAVTVLADEAVMLAVAALGPAVVETVKVAEVCPAGIVTDGVTVAAPLSDDKVTRTPPVGAGAPRVTVPVEVWPPDTEVGFKVSPLMVPVTVPEVVNDKAAVIVLADVAVMLAVVGDATAAVATVKVAEVCPAGIVTETGTVADPLDEANVTRTPPAAAGALNVTVPVDVPPPATLVGFSVKLPMVPVVVPAIPTVSVAVTVLADEAVMVAVPGVAPAAVEAVKVPEVCPAGMVIDEITVTPGLFEERSTRTPPVGAALLRVMVPVEV